MLFSKIILSKCVLRFSLSGIALSVAVVANAGWTVVKLEPTGATHSSVLAVSGQQQVGVARQGTPDHAAVWSGTASSWMDLHPPAAFDSRLLATNGASQGGYARVNDWNHASLWSGTAASWVDLHPSGATDSTVYALDGSQQIGIARFGQAYQGGMWMGTAASWVSLQPAGATSSWAGGAHAGRQVGSVRFGTVSHAALWSGSAASWVDLNPAGLQSTAVAIHGDQQVGASWDGSAKEHATLWTGTAASMVDLHPPGFARSQALGVHNQEQVGWVFDPFTFVFNAALWRGTAESFVDLSLALPSGYEDSSARSIWHSETVTYIGGSATRVSGSSQAIMWVSNEPGPPFAITVPQGIHISGGVSQVMQSDDTFYIAKPNYNVPRNTAPLQIEIEGESPVGDVSILKFRLEGGADLTGGTQTISLYNYSTNSYDLLDGRAIAGLGNKVDVVVTDNANRYLHPVSRYLKARVAVTPPLNATRAWTFQIDEATWGVTDP